MNPKEFKRCGECDNVCNCKYEHECGYLDNDDDDFTPCSDCDGHDACRDFGCAIDLGLEHMINPPL